MNSKICVKCKVEKLISEFHKHKRCRYGVNSVCKTCRGLARVKNRKHDKNNELQKMYGISLKEYNNILKKQNGVCAICGNIERLSKNKVRKPYMLSVDHNHKTKKVRGLLCSNCNNGLGRFKDNIQFLESAIKYLIEDEFNIK